MQYYTAAQAAQYLGRTEKTIRSWIKSGKLPAVSVKVRGVSQWQIAENVLDNLREVASSSTGTATADNKAELDILRNYIEGYLLDQIHSLKSQIQDSDERIEQLETRIAQLEAFIQQSPARTPERVPIRKQRETESVAQEALFESAIETPEGLPLAEAAPLVKLSRRQLSEILKTQDLEQRYHTAIAIEARPGQFNRYMSPEQIEAFKLWHVTK